MITSAKRAIESLAAGPAVLRGSRGFYLALAALTLFGAALRLYRLESPSFWKDELRTIEVCPVLDDIYLSKLLGYAPTALGLRLSGVDLSSVDPGAPETWRARGITERNARLPACILGILTIPCLALAGWRVLGSRAALLAALLLAVAPWHIYWSQAARFYSQQFLFYNLALLGYFAATRGGSRWRLAGAMGVLVLAFLSQPIALVLLGVLAADWLVSRVRGTPLELGAPGCLLVGGAVLFCLGIFIADYLRTPHDWGHYARTSYHSPLTLLQGTVYLTHPAVVAFAAMSGWLLLRERSRVGIYLVLAALVPVGVFAGLSFTHFVGTRYAFVGLFAWLAVAAVGAETMYDALRPRFGRLFAAAPVLVLLASVMLMDYGYYTRGAGFHPRWREAFALVAASRDPSDAVYAQFPTVGRYYLGDAAPEEMPETLEELRRAGRPAWLVFEEKQTVRGRRKEWVAGAAELEGAFDLHVVQPVSAVRVYYYDPDRQTTRGK